jgi:hypothetical protein
MKTIRITLGLLLLSLLPARAATEITAYVWITNTPAGLTSNIVINIGAADTRNWTNSTAGAPSTSIQITNSTAASATNLYRHIASYPVYSAGAGTPQLLAALNSTNTSVVNFTAPLNTNIAVTFGGLWARAWYVTNTYADSAGILNRTNAMSHPNRTNAENAIVNLLAVGAATNQIPLASPWLGKWMDTNTAQTVGNKTLIGPVLSGGRFTTVTNLTGTNVALTNVTLRLVTATGVDLTGVIAALSNGTIYATIIDGSRITNAFGIAGAIHQVIGGTWSNATLTAPTLHSSVLSNSTIYGSTTITGASLNLIGSGANNFISLTATSTTAAVGSIISLARENGITNAVDSADVLGLIVFTGYGTTAQKVGARIRAIPIETFTDSTAGTILLFETTPSGATQPVGRIHIGSDGYVTFSNHVHVAGNIVGATLTGTNRQSGISVRALQTITSAAAGNNTLYATNAGVRVTGTPGAAWTLASLSGIGTDGQEFEVYNDAGYTITIANESGFDATAANRIRTMSGADYTGGTNGVYTFRYDGNRSRWIMRTANP